MINVLIDLWVWALGIVLVNVNYINAETDLEQEICGQHQTHVYTEDPHTGKRGDGTYSNSQYISYCKASINVSNTCNKCP